MFVFLVDANQSSDGMINKLNAAEEVVIPI